MAIEVGTFRQALRRMAMVTTISVTLSVLITLLTLALMLGVDPDLAIPVSSAYKFCLVNAVAVPALICPIVCYRIVLAIRDRDRAHGELRRIAETDQLTGLLNRRGSDSAAKTVVAECNRGNLAMSVLMIDIDFFKNINDSFGHDFGDAALVLVASMRREVARSERFVTGRQGGEEFIALLPGLAGPEAVMIAERLRQACSRSAIEHDGKSACITVSIGVASGRQPASLSQLITAADQALYSAKRNGRNCVVLHQPVLPLTRAA